MNNGTGLGVLAGNLIGSYLLGRHQREMQMQDMEMKKEAQKLQVQQMKIQMDAAKLKADADARKDAFLQKYVWPDLEPKEGEETTGGVNYGASFGPSDKPQESRLTKILSNPVMAAALKEHYNIDFIGAGNLYARNKSEERQWTEFAERIRQNAIENQFKGQETHPAVQIEGEGGRKTLIYPRKYNLGPTPPAMGGGMPAPPQLGGGPQQQAPPMPRPQMGGIQTMPGVEQQPLGSAEKDNWVKIDPEKGTIIRPDYSRLTTPSQLAAAGFSYASKEQQSAVGEFAGVENILAKIESLMGQSIPKEESTLERIPGAAGRKVSEWLQTDEQIVQLVSLMEGTLAPMIRSMGEKGALANEDVARALGMMPKITDRGSVAWGKLRNIQEIIDGSKKAKLGDLAKEAKKNTPPPAALKALKEGKTTQFSNGQVWTLRNGQPVRIK